MNPSTQSPAQAVCPTAETDAELFVRPEVDIHETPSAYLLVAEMPGVNRERLEVSIDDDRLTLTGRKAPADGALQPLLRETAVASYRRVFQLSPEIDRERISARVEQGVVSVSLPKAQKPAPRRIAVV